MAAGIGRFLTFPQGDGPAFDCLLFPLIECVARSSRISGVFRHGGRHKGVTRASQAVTEPSASRDGT